MKWDLQEPIFSDLYLAIISETFHLFYRQALTTFLKGDRGKLTDGQMERLPRAFETRTVTRVAFVYHSDQG